MTFHLRARSRATTRVITAAAVLSLTATGLGSSSLADAATGAAGSPPSLSRTTSAGNPATGNPLAGNWGLYRNTSKDESYRAWSAASGTTKTLLAKIALTPKVKWFGQWIPTSQVQAVISQYIREVQAGDPNKLVQLALFRLWPRTEAAKRKPLTRAQQVDYYRWMEAARRAIGTNRVAVILEPDLAVALKGWRPRVRLSLARHAAWRLGSLPRASIYLDAGDSDWLKPVKAAAMLRAAGINYVRGFALGATHYASAVTDDSYGRQVVGILNSMGLPRKHFVIDTADNGRPFTYGQYFAAHRRGDFDNAETCASKTQQQCVTLGYKPTWNTADPTYNDAYLWFGRPWLYRQASPWNQTRALRIAWTTPYS